MKRLKIISKTGDCANNSEAQAFHFTQLLTVNRSDYSAVASGSSSERPLFFAAKS